MNRVNNTTAIAQPGYDLFVFGDSLSDIGQFFQKTRFPPSPAFNGRLSNGPLAAETVAQDLGLNISLKTDFAQIGSYSGRKNVRDLGPIKLGGVLDQIDQFKNNAASLGADAKDLYLIWAGGNDFLALSPTSTPADAQAIISDAVNNIATAVTTLAQSGAKNIVVAEQPNLGRVPFFNRAGAELAATVTGLVTTFNSALETTLNTLKGSLPGTNIILSNLFPVTEQVAQNPAAFGFANITSPYYRNVGDVAFVPVDPAADINQYFFWNDFHPTTNGHRIFANEFEKSIIAGITENITRLGTETADALVSFSGNDRLNGLGGADLLEGNPGNDRLLGGKGNDSLTGGAGNDLLVGDAGRDTLIGTAATGTLPGSGEIDTFRGGANADLFVLGDQQNAFYDDGKNAAGRKDYALIADFAKADKIQLHGKRKDYVFEQTSGSLPRGLGIYLDTTSGKTELIGIVQNANNVNAIKPALAFV
ncbi:MAG TPA: SGNH/GDSL hydrolase family protein [Trichocoleus sp.]